VDSLSVSPCPTKLKKKRKWKKCKVRKDWNKPECASKWSCCYSNKCWTCESVYSPSSARTSHTQVGANRVCKAAETHTGTIRKHGTIRHIFRNGSFNGKIPKLPALYGIKYSYLVHNSPPLTLSWETPQCISFWSTLILSSSLSTGLWRVLLCVDFRNIPWRSETRARVGCQKLTSRASKFAVGRIQALWMYTQPDKNQNLCSLL
jgi:hypothetical protein